MLGGSKKLLVIYLVLNLVCQFSFVGISAAADTEVLLKSFEDAEAPQPVLPPGVDVKPEFVLGPGPLVATVQKTSGKAYVIHPEEKVAYAAVEGMRLQQGDTLITGAASHMNIVMDDKSAIALAPNSNLTLTKVAKKTAQTKRVTSLFLPKGRFRFVVPKVAQGSTYQVRTPTAVCGVRGSDFAVAVAPQTDTKLSLLKRFLRGLALVQEAQAADGTLITVVVTGQNTSISFGGITGLTQTVGPLSLSSAATGAVASIPIALPLETVMSILSSIGPGLAGSLSLSQAAIETASRQAAEIAAKNAALQGATPMQVVEAAKTAAMQTATNLGATSAQIASVGAAAQTSAAAMAVGAGTGISSAAMTGIVSVAVTAAGIAAAAAADDEEDSSSHHSSSHH